MQVEDARSCSKLVHGTFYPACRGNSAFLYLDKLMMHVQLIVFCCKNCILNTEVSARLLIFFFLLKIMLWSKRMR